MENFIYLSILQSTKTIFMGRKYAIHSSDDVYFITFTVVNWIDIFTRDEYREIFIDSVVYCQKNKGLEVFAYCIMTNHVHLVIRAKEGFELSDIVRDLKSFTSRHIRKAIEQNEKESRREWMLWMFGRAGKKKS
ncbi:transposase [Bernardetia sp. ABR2-2B]|uniref:transposase n=1 Tax=Bernardetia sp. ABR2-2B TaxID=3127472 RepID=UPI0030CB090C